MTHQDQIIEVRAAPGTTGLFVVGIEARLWHVGSTLAGDPLSNSQLSDLMDVVRSINRKLDAIDDTLELINDNILDESLSAQRHRNGGRTDADQKLMRGY